MSIEALCRASIPDDEGYQAPTALFPVGDPTGCIQRVKPLPPALAKVRAPLTGVCACGRRALDGLLRCSRCRSAHVAAMRKLPKCDTGCGRRATCGGRCNAQRCRNSGFEE